MDWYLTKEQEWMAQALESAPPMGRWSVLVALCRHRRVRWPQKGWQECLDCLGRREYSSVGDRPGRWRRYGK